MSHDEIQNPKHYDLFPDGMQAIDVIEAALTPEEFAGYLKGNFLKYRLRAGEKGPAEKCLGKSEWYRDRLCEHHDFMNSEAITRAEHAKLKADAAGSMGIPMDLEPAALANAAAFNSDWPDETRRQDAAAEDEAWAAVEARMDSIGQNGPTAEHYPCGWCGAFPGQQHESGCVGGARE